MVEAVSADFSNNPLPLGERETIAHVLLVGPFSTPALYKPHMVTKFHALRFLLVNIYLIRVNMVKGIFQQ